MVDKPDPWVPAQEALFEIIRAWCKTFPDVDHETVAEECLGIMMKVNQTKGAPFIFVCELARLVSSVLVKYMLACEEEFPDAEKLMHEIEILELDYIEEFTVAEFEEENNGS